MEVIRTYTLNDAVLETITLVFDGTILNIKINGKVLDNESYQYHYIDVQYNNVYLPYEFSNKFINDLLDILHEPFPSDNSNEIYNNSIEITKANKISKIPKINGDDTELFLLHYPDFKSRNVINKKYTSLLLDD
jgi:hypothetical protein